MWCGRIFRYILMEDEKQTWVTQFLLFFLSRSSACVEHIHATFNSQHTWPAQVPDSSLQSRDASHGNTCSSRARWSPSNKVCTQSSIWRGCKMVAWNCYQIRWVPFWSLELWLLFMQPCVHHLQISCVAWMPSRMVKMVSQLTSFGWVFSQEA